MTFYIYWANRLESFWRSDRVTCESNWIYFLWFISNQIYINASLVPNDTCPVCMCVCINKWFVQFFMWDEFVLCIMLLFENWKRLVFMYVLPFSCSFKRKIHYLHRYHATPKLLWLPLNLNDLCSSIDIFTCFRLLRMSQ